jgi:DNA-binding transcriptional ArsR family regulator
MDDLAAATLTKALGHPIRIEFLRALNGRRELSPSEFARDTGEALGNVAYHVKALHEAEIVEVASKVPRRGALEHRYALSGPHAGAAMAVVDLLAGA